jgi:aminopeptidase N
LTSILNLTKRQPWSEQKCGLSGNPASAGKKVPLELNGEKLEIRSVRLDGVPIDPSGYAFDGATLKIADVPDSFDLDLETIINPRENTELEGLYLSKGNFCTQCEAEGFRRITCFPDRPDVMTEFTTTIVADPGKYPVLLSNGNLLEQGHLADGRHYAVWHDPFRKPCYLFALVAGNLVRVKDRFITMSGRVKWTFIFMSSPATAKNAATPWNP